MRDLDDWQPVADANSRSLDAQRKGRNLMETGHHFRGPNRPRSADSGPWPFLKPLRPLHRIQQSANFNADRPLDLAGTWLTVRCRLGEAVKVLIEAARVT